MLAQPRHGLLGPPAALAQRTLAAGAVSERSLARLLAAEQQVLSDTVAAYVAVRAILAL